MPPHSSADPFASAEEAWFWTVGALRARREQTGAAGARIARPCDPDDVLLCVERLVRGQRIDPAHLRVLGIWGERQQAPNGYGAANRDAAMWREALAQLSPVLRRKGIVL